MKHLLLWIALAFLLMTGGIWISRLPYFQIASISIVNTDGSENFQHTDRERIFETVRPYLTGSFFSVNLHHAQQAAQRLEWVRRIRIDRIPPDAVKITAEEYRPAARWMRSGEQAGLVSDNGEVFQAAYNGTLPEFDGDVNEQKLMLLQYESFNNQLKPLRLKILRLQYSPRGAWTMMLSNGIELRLGKDSANARMARFVELYPRELSAQAKYLDYVDMRYPDAFAVRRRADAPAPEPALEQEDFPAEEAVKPLPASAKTKARKK